MDRYEAMRIFARVADLQSFTKSADSLGLPKATISNAVQEIEALVGVRLLNRTTRQVSLTPEGASFLERTKDLLIDVDDTVAMFRRESGELTGKIRVDMAAAMANETFLPLLPQFTDRHPRIEIELSSSDRTVDLIRDGVDVVLRSGKSNQPGMVEKKLGEAKLVNCVSPAYAKKFGKPKNLDDLKNHRLIFYAQTLGARAHGFEYFDGEKYREVKMAGTVTVNNTDSYRSACLAGFGIIQAPYHGLRKEIEAGRLVEVLPKFSAEPMAVHVIYPQRRLLANRVRVFLEWFEPTVTAILKR